MAHTPWLALDSLLARFLSPSLTPMIFIFLYLGFYNFILNFLAYFIYEIGCSRQIVLVMRGKVVFCFVPLESVSFFEFLFLFLILSVFVVS